MAKWSSTWIPFPQVPDAQALNALISEFGGVHAPSDDPKERGRRLILAQEMIRTQPKVRVGGVEYSAPYSYGLHLAALRRDRDRLK